MTTKRKPKVPVESLPIHTWTPDTSGQLHLAMIGNLPVTFRGKTSDEARANAEQFRIDEMAKHARAIKNIEATRERNKKRKENAQ